LYTFQALYIFSRIPAADSEHSAEKIQQQIPNIQQRRSSSRFEQQKIQQQIPNIQQKIQQQIPNIQQRRSSSRFRTFSRRSSSRFSSRCNNNKDSLFRPHPPFSQPSKEDYEQNFAATRAQLSSIFERVS
jgi:hypothetical protein